ncbi:MAG: hypothetical protein QOG91_512 [Candidatus Parcubacteria bacterium]|nr:hypothetical protein [Candidatus Parcubacteria bacterium]
MSQRLVTSQQVSYVRQLINDQRFGRAAFQDILDNGVVVRLLDYFKVINKATIRTDIVRTHVVRIEVRPERHSPAAIDQNVILVNFPLNGGSYDLACAWAENMGLEKTDASQISAISEQHPALYKQLGFTENPCGAYLMYIAATAVHQDKVHTLVWQKSRDDHGAVTKKLGSFWAAHMSATYAWFAFLQPRASA